MLPRLAVAEGSQRSVMDSGAAKSTVLDRGTSMGTDHQEETNKVRGEMSLRRFHVGFSLLSLAVALVAVLHWCDIPPDIAIAPGAGHWWTRLKFVTEAPSEGVNRPHLDVHIALLLLIGCALPFILGFTAARLAHQRADLTEVLRLSADKIPPTQRGDGDNELSELRRTISLEWERRNVVCSNADLQAKIWGFLGTLAVSGGVMAAATFGLGVEQGDTRQPDGISVALAVLAAVAMSFSLNFAQVLIRSAEHDASPALFSNASRDLLVSTVVAVIAVTLLPTRASTSPSAIGLGLCAGLLGPRALGPIKDYAARVFGVKASPGDSQLPLTMIEGLTNDVVDRLAEEAIQSVHALATMNTPRVYLATPYTWEQVIDWQTQAVFLEQLGPVRLTKFREWSPIRRVEDALRIAWGDTSLGDLAKKLGLETPEETRKVIAQLQSSTALRMLELYRKHGNLVLRQIVAGEPVAPRTMAVTPVDVGADVREASGSHPISA